MRNIKIIADSASDVLSMTGVEYAFTPLKIITDEREFIDNDTLDVAEMVEYLSHYKGKTHSACPGTGDWLEAFGDADEVFCVTITGNLSGSYNAACVAKQLYESEHEGRRVYVVDSLSTGPEMRLILDKLSEYVQRDMAFDDICTAIEEYCRHTGLVFMLKSLTNLANNGRVSPMLAKVVGIAGIRVLGKASTEGTLEQMDKCRGEAKTFAKIAAHFREEGLSQGRVYIGHCLNASGALSLQTLLRQEFPQAQVEIFPCRGLCSFYAEKGGMIVGFEKF